MRILGLDVGKKRIGLAISDPQGIVSEALGTIECREEEKLFSKLLSLLKEKQIGEIIIGFPLSLNGTIGRESERILAFIEKLKDKVNIPVKPWDERFTTKIATDLLIKADLSRRRRKRLVDKVSAVLILQSYLDSQNISSFPPDDLTTKCHPEC